MMNRELATIECLVAIQIFCGSLQQYDTLTDEADSNRLRFIAAKLRDSKQSVVNLRLAVQNPSSSPAVLREAIAAVTEEHTKFAEYVNSFALIYRLPNEILTIIFELAAAGHDPNFPCPQYVRRPSELDVSHVSRHWRDVAVNAPSLWTKWGAYITPSNNLMSIYFHRSSNLKVDVDLCYWKAHTKTSVCQACASEGQAGKYHDASELLKMSLHRFRSLAISSITTSLTELLKRIALTVSSSPTLSFVSLVCLSINANFVTVLHGQETLLNFQEFRNILSASPNLAVLQLADAVVPCSEIMDLAGTECIVLPSLMRLCLDEPDEPSYLYSTSILAALKAPKLRYFDCHHNFPEDDVDQFHSAFFENDHTPRFPSVQELSLSTSGAFDEDEDAFFDVVVKAFPAVTDVTLKYTDIKQFGAALARVIQPSERGYAADPWPCLQHLSLYRPLGNDLLAICTWLKLRSNFIYQPRRLSFKVSDPISDLSGEDGLCLRELEMYGDLTLENINLEVLRKFEEDGLNVDEEEI
ncbi:hypothetical protein BJ138DRAFT_171867 [Hygrophoropsis aurantiaca]|uniref:Uncharacterized protein n=1 Tax=Hygrophoropsis aurantiaca TaxID=72124 RepID=A0ACB8APJ4_9AGAM|nr:hypothetical protein BJ138DRAFT_171867 [Hygrophoropsis aurantiaca]